MAAGGDGLSVGYNSEPSPQAACQRSALCLAMVARRSFSLSLYGGRWGNAGRGGGSEYRYPHWQGLWSCWADPHKQPAHPQPIRNGAPHTTEPGGAEGTSGRSTENFTRRASGEGARGGGACRGADSQKKIRPPLFSVEKTKWARTIEPSGKIPYMGTYAQTGGACTVARWKTHCTPPHGGHIRIAAPLAVQTKRMGTAQIGRSA